MRLTDLIGSEVVGLDGRRQGIVTDVRMVQDGPLQGTFGAALRVHSLVLGKRMLAAHLGFDRAQVRGPWMLKRLVAALQGPSRTVPWQNVRMIAPERIHVDGEPVSSS